MNSAPAPESAQHTIPGPLIVQSDRTVLLEVAHPLAEDARHDLAVFAELERAPEHIHTYRITRLGLWNARAAGHTAEDMLATLERWSKFPIPQSVSTDMAETVGRYGRLVIERDDEGTLILTATDTAVLAEIARGKKVANLLFEKRGDNSFVMQQWARGELKQELLKIGWPAEDLAGYTPGTPHEIDLDHEGGFALRAYQNDAVTELLRPRLRGRGAALWRRQDARGRRRDGRLARPPRSSS